MLQVNNKKIVREIAFTTYRANKKRSLLAVFAIFLTTFLITTVLAVGISYWAAISERQIRMEGMDYDIELSEPREDQTEKIRTMDQVEYAGVAVKCAVLQQYENKTLEKSRLYWLDETCWEKQTIPALESYEGHYPRGENEIMLSAVVLKDMGIEAPKVGMELPLTYYTLEEGGNEESLHRDFILSGWYTDYSGAARGYVSETFYKESGVKQTDFTQGTLKITLKSPLYSEKNITKMQKDIGLADRQIISADYDSIASFIRTVAALAALLVMIFVSGYLFIYNTMYIAVSKDIRYYGQLKTVGMTSRQLRRMTQLQALWNGAAGIALGLLLGAAAVKAVIPRCLHLIDPGIAAEAVPLKWQIFLIAGCFAYITNLVSIRKPVRMAQECSPIEALRYTGIKAGKKARKREGGSVGSMAFYNLFRDRKQAAVILSSFVIAISVFMAVNTVIRGNDAKRILDQSYTYDLQIKNETTLDDDREQVLTEERIGRVRKIEGVSQVGRVTSAKVIIPFQEDVYGDYLEELYDSRYSPGDYEQDMELYREDKSLDYFAPRFIGVDDHEFEIINERLGNVLDKEDFESGKIAVAAKSFTEGDNGITGKTVRFSLPDGKDPGREYSIKIGAVGDTYANPAFFAGGILPDLIVSEKYAKELLKEPFTELIDVTYDESYSSETEEAVKAVFAGDKKVSTQSKLERYLDMKTSENQIKVLGGGMALIILLLAVLNYLNMMAASVQNRSRELAALESIGMTSRQIRRMLRTEGLGYAAISIGLSLLAGLPVSYVVFSALSVYRIPFSVPWAGNLILFAAAVLICMTAPVLIYSRTQNDSVIGRLQREET